MNTEEINFLKSCATDEESFNKLLHFVKKDRRFRDLSDISISGVVITKDGVIVDINMTTANMFGYSLEEILHRSLFDFVAPETASIAFDNMKNGFTEAYEIAAVHKDGHTFPVEVAGKSIEYDDDQYRITIVRDITERKRLEAKLEEFSKNKRAIIESTSDLIWTLNHDYCLLDFNSSFYNDFFDIFGIYPAKGICILDFIQGELFEPIRQYYERAFSGERLSYEVQYKVGEQTVYLEANLNPIMTGNSVTGLAAFGRNISERKRNEKSLQDSQENLLALIENTNDSIWSVDTDYRIIAFNSAYGETFF